jgi:iron complex outermembrane receptor protein
MTMRIFHHIALSGGSLLAMAAPMQANAQNAPMPQDAGVGSSVSEEIIVTARRRDESVQDVPQVVQAVSAEEVGRLNLREFTEVQNLVPGLQLSNNANGIGGNAQLRGVNFDINASGFNATVEFYQNDAPISAGLVLQQIYDIGQIEVLRGPQGTLRGRASPSGSITVTTRKPDLNEIGGYVDLTANTIGTQNVNGAINIPVIAGIAAIRVAGVVEQGEGNGVKSIYKGPGADARAPYVNARGGRISALVEPMDWLRFAGVFQRIDRFSRQFNQVESFNQVNPAAPASPVTIRAEDRLGSTAQPRQTKAIYDIYNGRAEASQFGQQLIYQFGYYTQKVSSYDITDTANLFPTSDSRQHTVSDIGSTSHELRLQNQERVLGLFDYVVGAFDYINTTPTTLNSPTVIRLPLAFGGGVALVNQTAVGRTGRSHERSYYGNLTAHIGESTEASGGVRAIRLKSFGALSINGVQAARDDTDDHKLIYTASLKHNFSSDLMIYANTGSSYRPGPTAVGDFNIAPSARERSFLTIPAEKSKSYEVGIKSALFDRRLRLNLSGYHQTFDNFPYRSPNGVYYVNTVAVRNGAGVVTGIAQQVAVFNFISAVPVKVNGVEIELSGDIASRFSASLVASYADGKIKKGLIPCNDLDGNGLPDVSTTAPTLAALQSATGPNNLSQCNVTQRSAFQSPFSATLQSEYSMPISDRVHGFVRGLLSYNGQSQGDPTSAYDDVGRYGLLNLFFGVRDPGGMWELTAYAKNITDTVKVLTRGNPYTTSYQQLPGAIIGGVPTITGSPTGATSISTYTPITSTPRREFGLNFKFRFGAR